MTVNLDQAFLNHDQLQAGDICLKLHDGGLISHVIANGQGAILSGADQQNAGIVHAGIMVDGDRIIESQGSGVTLNDITTNNHQYGYEIYRCLLTNIADGAATAAQIVLDSHNSAKTAKYTIFGAAKSLLRPKRPASGSVVDAIMDRLTKGKSRDFFCSQFVVYCFQLAAEQNAMPAQTMFNLADKNYSPAKLMTTMQESQFFYRAGRLRPGVR